MVEVPQSLLKLFSKHTIVTYRGDGYNNNYNGGTLESDLGVFVYRKARKTPAKKGYFLALWSKDVNGVNIPYTIETPMDALIIEIDDDDERGVFIFSKELLQKYSILSDRKKPGKMAFRVYPSFETNLNTTATKSQKWQREYYYDLNDVKHPAEDIMKAYKNKPE